MTLALAIAPSISHGKKCRAFSSFYIRNNPHHQPQGAREFTLIYKKIRGAGDIKRILWKNILIVLVFTSTTLAQAQTTRDIPKTETIKIIEKIVGRWELQRIIDVSGTQKESSRNKKSEQVNVETPATNSLQILEFDTEGRYKAHSLVNPQDSGSYRINERHGLLYLESNADDITPTQWTISIQRNIMTLVGQDGQQRSKGTKYVYIKTKEG